MAIVMCEGGYRNVETVYMRKLPADPIYAAASFALSKVRSPSEIFTVQFVLILPS